MSQRHPGQRTLAESLRHHAELGPDLRAVTEREVRSYAELAADVSRLADTLRGHGLGSGERIAILARNSLAYVQLVYAGSWSGVAVACLNWRLSRDEALLIQEDVCPRLVFAEREFADLVAPGSEVVWLDDPSVPFGQWFASGDPDTVPAAAQGMESVALIMYTTGTTGDAKGVQLIERNLWHMCEQASRSWRMHAEMRFLACLPLFHISGMSSVLCSVHVGGEIVIPGGTTVPEISRAIQDRRVTHTVLVPTVLAGIVAEKATADYDLTSLEVVVYGSAPSGSTLIGEAMAILPETGFSQGYGLTETSAGVAIAPILRFGDHDEHPGSVGTIVSNCECRIVSITTGADLPNGQDGEIWLRTPQLTIGYLNKPEHTRAAIDDDGWFRSGDIGSLDDDGYLYICDRIKDMIISGGENIYSVEVENAITAHPDVHEAAVFGVPDARWGEIVKAVIVTAPGATLDHTGLEEWLLNRLARYKQPRIVDFVATLPKTGSGKILKRALRESASLESARS